MLIIVNRCDCSGTISSAGLRQDTDRKVDGENTRFRNLVGRGFLFSQLTSNGTASPGGPLACWVGRPFQHRVELLKSVYKCRDAECSGFID